MKGDNETQRQMTKQGVKDTESTDKRDKLDLLPCGYMHICAESKQNIGNFCLNCCGMSLITKIRLSHC